jgi:ADP-ribose pyrophosphatase YjhB (NUDIX family)
MDKNKAAVHKVTTYKYQGVNYPVIMLCVDAVVYTWNRSGALCVAMIRRRDNKKYALPGGFVNYKEDLFHASVRELKEETNLQLSVENYRGRLIFDDPKRTKVGNRRITIAHVFKMSGVDGDMPKLTAGDDAGAAFWIPYKKLLKIKTNLIHDDHGEIVSECTCFI